MALFSFCCRKRRHNKYRKQVSCWRNPFVVFLLSFVALGSLRFRVRTKRAAQRMFHKKSSVSNDRGTIQYKLEEEGKLSTGAAFQRYAAFEVTSMETPDATPRPLSVLEWAHEVLLSESCLHDLIETISSSPYKALFWETKGVTVKAAAETYFEMVLVDAPQLAKFVKGKPNPEAFASHFGTDSKCRHSTVGCVFENLGKDATLIAPKPVVSKTTESVNTDTSKHKPTDDADFSHLAVFCRNAPQEIAINVWRLAIETFSKSLVSKKSSSDEPVWFSTSGMGIAWLHFRVDSSPKYYSYQPFIEPNK
jgi:hypothetical protein